MMAIWRRKFTLVELIVAMTLVSTIMLVLFSFLASSQRTWSLSDSAARIYRNSRTAFNIIERDLQCIVNSAVPNREIGLHVFGPTPTDANDALHACLVASTGPLEGAYSRLCEITYKHHVDPGDPATQYYLTRQLVSDNDSANWDFLGQPAGWWLNNNPNPDLAGFEKVVGGVAEFSMTFHTEDNAVFSADSDTVVRPARVVVDLVLFDESLKNLPAPQRFKTQRSFTKVFYLGHLQN
ncbi:MAG: hypothetical protein QGF67_02110 [Lentisphaeria bacterium]|jgi:type II secretory pathway pseudopilin PulG|nr:hypothetical protein [Lentisphaeria bacterium]